MHPGYVWFKNLWHCRLHKISTESILENLEISYWQDHSQHLQVFYRVSCLDPFIPTAWLPGMKRTAGKATHCWYSKGKTLTLAGPTTEQWVSNIGSPYVAAVGEEILGLPPGAFKFKLWFTIAVNHSRPYGHQVPRSIKNMWLSEMSSY